MLHLRRVIGCGLIAALIAACGGQAASQGAASSGASAATGDGRVKGTAHYETTGDPAASGDLSLKLSYVDGSNPGTASLEFQDAAPASSGEPDDLIISVHPSSSSLDLKTSTI